jgi:hypothetical protein
MVLNETYKLRARGGRSMQDVMLRRDWAGHADEPEAMQRMFCKSEGPRQSSDPLILTGSVRMQRQIG